jgi:hypothetical protein
LTFTLSVFGTDGINVNAAEVPMLAIISSGEAGAGVASAAQAASKIMPAAMHRIRLLFIAPGLSPPAG